MGSVLLTILVTVLVFGLLIAIHEFGHYMVARAFGVGVIDFSIGMGPKIKSWHGKYNDFTLRAIPIGGFVNMVGEYDEDIPEEYKYKIPLNSKPVWQRMLIVLAGPFMNILLAFLVMAILVSTGPAIASTTISKFADGSRSEQTGLMENDEIIKVDGKRIRCANDMAYKISSSGTKPIDIKVIRDGKEILVENVEFPQFTEKNTQFGQLDFYVYPKEKTFGSVISESFWQSVSVVYVTVDSLIDAFTGRYGLDAVGGPVAVGGVIGDTISASESFAQGLYNIGNLIVLISVSLGICNLLPIPVLDGGRFLFYIIEAIRRKPMNPKVEQAISMVFMVLLFGFMIFITLKDIVGLF